VAVASARPYANLQLTPDNHASIPPLNFLQARCPTCHPANSVKTLKANTLSLFKLIFAFELSFCELLNFELLNSAFIVTATTKRVLNFCSFVVLCSTSYFSMIKTLKCSADKVVLLMLPIRRVTAVNSLTQVEL